MPEILDQNAIDALLNEVVDIDLDEHDNDDFSGEKVTSRQRGGSIKPAIREKNITAPYVSPVLKSEKILFNPQITEIEESLNELPVVRTLHNYNQKYSKNDKKSYIK